MSTENNISQKVTTFLWFDTQAEEAAKFYTSVFKDGRILETHPYPTDGPQGVGSVMIVTFALNGQEFIALNAGPHVKFNEAVSLFIKCSSQEEVDYYWEKLTADGGQEGDCGWLKDKFGLSWQVAPVALLEAISDPDKAKAKRAMDKMMTMKKIDLDAILNA